MNVILKDIIFQYKRKGRDGGGVFVYANEVIVIKEQNNIECVG